MDYYAEIENLIIVFTNSVPEEGLETEYLEEASELLALEAKASRLEETTSGEEHEKEMKLVYERIKEIVY